MKMWLSHIHSEDPNDTNEKPGEMCNIEMGHNASESSVNAE